MMAYLSVEGSLPAGVSAAEAGAEEAGVEDVELEPPHAVSRLPNESSIASEISISFLFIFFTSK